MIAQVLLTAGLGACVAYVASLGRALPVVRFGLFGLSVVGLVFIWRPEVTNQLAHAVGIGRGADLMLYVWLLMSLFLILRLHLLLRAQGQQATQLARAVTLLRADVEAARREG